ARPARARRRRAWSRRTCTGTWSTAFVHCHTWSGVELSPRNPTEPARRRSRRSERRRTYETPFPHPSGARPPDLPKELIPRHVALIMDGDGRWAKARGLPRTEGHKRGEGALLDVI